MPVWGLSRRVCRCAWDTKPFFGHTHVPTLSILVCQHGQAKLSAVVPCHSTCSPLCIMPTYRYLCLALSYSHTVTPPHTHTPWTFRFSTWQPAHTLWLTTHEPNMATHMGFTVQSLTVVMSLNVTGTPGDHVGQLHRHREIAR